MNDEQRSMALFQAQPGGPGLCFRPAALSLAYVEQPHRARSALLDKNRGPAVRYYSLRTPPKVQASDSIRFRGPPPIQRQV
ncbi:MAG TPA: hypothetical protein ENK51_03090 [Gammaproteobacteria bacterium]|nr:hypothetical protein [Gammaproteobacteria bacterium]